MTLPFDRKDLLALTAPEAPKLNGPARFRTHARNAPTRPMAFARIMEAIGSDDGREVARDLDELHKAGWLKRMPQGEYSLIEDSKT